MVSVETSFQACILSRVVALWIQSCSGKHRESTLSFSSVCQFTLDQWKSVCLDLYLRVCLPLRESCPQWKTKWEFAQQGLSYDQRTLTGAQRPATKDPSILPLDAPTAGHGLGEDLVLLPAGSMRNLLNFQHLLPYHPFFPPPFLLLPLPFLFPLFFILSCLPLSLKSPWPYVKHLNIAHKHAFRKKKRLLKNVLITN